MKSDEFYQWLWRWFNPKKALSNIPPLAQQKPYGWDLTENLFNEAPQSFDHGWMFNGLPHQVLTIQSLTTEPAIGHITCERKRHIDHKIFTLIDHLPIGSVFNINIVFHTEPMHLKKIDDSAVGHHAQAVKVRHELQQAEVAIANGDALLPVVMTVYVRGDDHHDLNYKTAKTEALLNSNGFKVIHEDELFPIDAYLRYLPMCYDYQFDKANNYRSRFMLLSDVAKLLPFYGRSRGTGNPGFIAFNRGGEPWYYDFFKDRTKNAHLLLLGETGTGKSNLLNFLLMHTLALYRPRLFIIEAGGSFDLLGDYCASLGLTVNKIKIDLKKPIALNPFSQSVHLLKQIRDRNNSQNKNEADKSSIKNSKINDNYRENNHQEANHLSVNKNNNTHANNNQNDEIENKVEDQTKEKIKHGENSNATDDESRDILGEMTLAAITMITGGEAERITRADRMLIIDALIDAAQTAEPRQMIASDLVDAFQRLAQRLDHHTELAKIMRCRDMADSLRYFTQDPVSNAFFNTAGEPWPLVDITIVNFGLFANEGYEAQRAIAFTGCMNKMLALAEANQYSNRPIISVCDENHIFTKLPTLANLQTLIAKTGRKLGLWLWLATQNMRDFANEAHKMLAMIETWVCLALPPDEIAQIQRFKPLTAEQRALFLSAKKSPQQYTEGVLLSPKLQGLFRHVPPKLYLAMAATEQHEKHLRQQLMQQSGKSELQIVHDIAQQMMVVNYE